MTAAKKKINRIELMKWVTLLSMVVTALGSLGGQVMLPGIPVSISTSKVQFTQPGAAKVSQAEWSVVGGVFKEIEVEIEDDHHWSDGLLFPLFSWPLVHDKSSTALFFLPRRILKLFILFHSWKSFLSI